MARAIRARLGQIRSCYERELPRDPSIAGRVEVQFTVGTDGAMTQVTVFAPAGFGAAGACIRDVLRAIPMPRPEGGAVDFVFPFTFTPGT